MRCVARRFLLPVLLLAACRPVSSPKAPRIVSFAASQVTVKAGAVVTLSYQVEGATEVSISDQFGKDLVLNGDASRGTAEHPPEVTSFFILRAKNESGRDTAFVQVAVEEPVRDAFLIAVPPEVDAGSEVELLYSAVNGTKITLETDSGTKVSATGTSGVVRVTPDKTTTYTLRAEGFESAVETTSKVSVRPVIQTFTVDPAAARAGEKMTFRWKTAAASTLKLKERTLGTLVEPTEVSEGEFEWTVPTINQPEGFPFYFTLEATSIDPDWTASKTLNSFLGQGPQISQFTAPSSVTLGRPLTLQWKTINAQRMQLLANGKLIFEPQAGSASVTSGTFSISAFNQSTVFELRAFSFNELLSSKTLQVQAVKAPKIKSFQMPTTVFSPQSAAQATWQTEDATEVSIYLYQAGSVFFSDEQGTVTNGSVNLFPATSTTYELVARNAAGDEVASRKTVTVANPSLFDSSARRTTPSQPVDFTYDFPAAVRVMGVPSNTPQPVFGSTAFLDLAIEPQARVIHFEDGAEGLAAIQALSGFRFPLRGKAFSSFWVSTNGFVAMEEPPSPLPGNTSFASDNTLPPMMAPFWDNLELGSGDIRYLIDGNEFPRRLIIQWTNVNIEADASSQLTFQLQMWESGELKFVYKTLMDAQGVAQGQTATVGVSLGFDRFYGQHAFNAGVLSEGLELAWFSTDNTSGNFSTTTDFDETLMLSWQSVSGQVVTATAEIDVLRRGDIIINEAMPVPDAAFPSGSWIELYNPNSTDFHLGGLRIRAMGSSVGDTFAEGLMVPAGGYLVLGQTYDTSLNGNAPVQLILNDVPLSAADLLMIEAGSGTLAELEWVGAQPGKAVVFPQKAIDATGTQAACALTQTFNSQLNTGTPGSQNEICFEYAAFPILGHFEDISTTGTELLASGSSDGAFGTFNLPVPFKYYGIEYSSISLSMDGFATIGYPLSNTTYVNNVAPGASTPNGTLAVFWDDLQRKSTGKLLTQRRSNYTIYSWQEFSHYFQDNTLNFQLKLFDNGVIEFHYGKSAPYDAETTGSSATAWLEKPAGSYAIPIHIEMPDGLLPFTGWRFVPKP